MGRQFLLGVTAGIAAYKAATLVRHWMKNGDTVTVIPTPTSLNFVGKTTWEALSNNPVHTDVFHGATHVEHVDYGRHADAFIIAPATANTIARLAHGLSNDLLSATALACTCPVIICPAMHTQMWHNPATQRNIAILKSYGYHIVDPGVGDLTSGDSGVGRLADTDDIIAAVDAVLAPPVLAGKKVIVSGGGTREPLDPVRFLGNASSGKQGAHIALSARRAGADVTFVAASIDSDVRRMLGNIPIVDAPTADDMHREMSQHATQADIVVMTAAVADFRPVAVKNDKIKKVSDDYVPDITLEQTVDVLRSLVEQRHGKRPIIVGFAAETGTWDDMTQLGRQKIAKKGCDLLLINNVSGGDVFGKDTNTVIMMDSSGSIRAKVDGTKRDVADTLINEISTLMPQ